MYQIKNLAKTRDGINVTMPFSPGTVAKALAKHFRGQLDGLARVIFNEPEYYQIYETGEGLTGYDNLLLKLKYPNGHMLIHFVDLGYNVFPIGYITTNGKSEPTIELYPQKPRGSINFHRELQDEEIKKLLKETISKIHIEKIIPTIDILQGEKIPEYLSLKRLYKWNRSFDHNHVLLPRDARIVNELIHVIKHVQNKTLDPCPGDVVGDGRIEGIWTDDKGVKKANICFDRNCSVHADRSKKTNEFLCVSISGGPWQNIPLNRLRFKKHTRAMFWTWGHTGATANGSVHFPTTVRMFEIKK